MENKMSGTEKQANEQRASSAIFTALKGSYRTSVEFSGQKHAG